MSRVVALRQKLKPEFEANHGVNVTYLAFVARRGGRNPEGLPVGPTARSAGTRSSHART